MWVGSMLYQHLYDWPKNNAYRDLYVNNMWKTLNNDQICLYPKKKILYMGEIV